jgi:hypothetical protein
VAERVDFPDPEGVLCAFLTAQNVYGTYAGVKASTKVPATRPARFIRAYSIGGFDPTMVTAVTRFVVEGWGATESAAQGLCSRAVAQIVTAARAGVMGSTTVTSVNVVSRPQNLPDPDSNQSRYTATVEVAMRGASA